MASKKNGKTEEKTVKSSKKVSGENKGPNGELRIDDASLQRLCRLEAELRAGKNQFSLEQLQMANYIASLDKEGAVNRMQNSLRALVQHIQAAEAAYEALRDEVGKKLGINLREFSFDDQSGILHPLDQKKA